MRAAFRRRNREDEEESVFVSMTDMTVSFLFILMIMLAFFASQSTPEDSVTRAEFEAVKTERDQARVDLTAANETIADLEAQIVALRAEIERLKAALEEERKNPLERYLAETADARRRILERLRDQLRVDFPDLRVELSEENDALRFQGDGLFASGQSVLRPDKHTIVETIADRLEQILPCYTLGAGAHWSADCNSGAAIIEAVQIEGHTDSTGDGRLNLELSTQRANETFMAMLGRQPSLDQHLNFKKQPVLSVAGYGKMRPIATNDTAGGRATNRRIDLRIIMYTPAVSGEIARIRADLGAVEETPK